MNKKVYFTSDKFNQFFKEIEDDLLELVGYTAYNGSLLIGEITEIYDNTSQLLAEIKHNQETFLVPLVEDFIISIDDAKKKVIMELPEGILTL